MAFYNDLVTPERFHQLIGALPKELRKMPAESHHLHVRDFELQYATNQVVTARQAPSDVTYPCVRKLAGKVLFV